ncbi:hypothetical protein Hanom_Chr15g01349221 [Helianthus anomalus]
MVIITAASIILTNTVINYIICFYSHTTIHISRVVIITASKMSFSSLRVGQFCDFRLKACFSAYGSKRFKILLFSSDSLTSFIFLH